MRESVCANSRRPLVQWEIEITKQKRLEKGSARSSTSADRECHTPRTVIWLIEEVKKLHHLLKRGSKAEEDMGFTVLL